MKNLALLIDKTNAVYSDPYDKPFLDAGMFIGDPLADEAVAALNEQSYQRGADKLAAIQALAQSGERRAQNFLDHAQTPPPWLDKGLITLGQRVALAFSSRYGLSLTHSLFAGALFARATLVTRSTGRLGSSPATRIKETGAFIAAILQPHALDIGAGGWRTAVKVRLLHASIRRWLKDSPGFSENYVGEPLDQTMLAMTLGLFSYLNMRSFARLGSALDPIDLRAHHHLWRYVGWLLGVNENFLTHNLEQERKLWSALVAHQTFPQLFGDRYFDDATAVVAQLSGRGEEIAPLIRALYMRLSGPAWFGLEREPARDWRLAGLMSLATAQGFAYRWLPRAPARMAARGRKAFGALTKLADAHDFEMKIIAAEEAEDSARLWEALSQGVKAHFADVLAHRQS